MSAENSQPPDFETLLARSIEELRLKTEAHDGMWHIGESSWAVDQDVGTIVFTNQVFTVTAPVQIIGTYNTNDGTWLWGWNHPSVLPPLQEHARQVYEYGRANGIERLTTQKLACSENEAWELAALACTLCDAQGAYRGPSGPTLVYMTFGTLQITKPS